jgi:hypothetical protein
MWSLGSILCQRPKNEFALGDTNVRNIEALVGHNLFSVE